MQASTNLPTKTKRQWWATMLYISKSRANTYHVAHFVASTRANHKRFQRCRRLAGTMHFVYIYQPTHLSMHANTTTTTTTHIYIHTHTHTHAYSRIVVWCNQWLRLAIRRGFVMSRIDSNCDREIKVNIQWTQTSTITTLTSTDLNSRKHFDNGWFKSVRSKMSRLFKTNWTNEWIDCKDENGNENQQQ